MKRLFKIFAVLILLVGIVAVSGLVVLRRMYPPEKLKELAVGELKAASGRDVRVQSADIGWNGLRVAGFEMSEAGGFGAGTFLKVDSVRVVPRLLPLLHKKIEVSNVSIAGVSCRLVKRPDGAFNFSDIGETPLPASPAVKKSPQKTAKATPEKKSSETAVAVSSAPEPSSLAAAWSVGSVRLSDGDVEYADAKAGVAAAVHHIRISIENLQPHGETQISFSMDVDGKLSGKPLRGTLNYKGSVDLGGLDPAKMALRLEPLHAELQGITFDATGNVGAGPDSNVSLSISIPKQPAERWKTLPVPPGFEPPGLTAQLEGKRTAAGLDIKTLEVDAGASTAPDGAKLPPAHLSFSGTLEQPKSSIREASLKLGDMTLSAQGTVTAPAGKPAQLNLKAETNVFPVSDLTALAPSAAQYNLQGKLSLKLAATGTTGAPALTGNLNVQGVGAKYDGQTLSGLTGAVKLAPTQITAQLTGKLNQGDLTVSATASDYQTKPNLQLNGSLSLLDLSQLPTGKTAPAEQKTAPTPASPSANAPSSAPTAPAKKTPAPAQAAASAAPIKSSGKFTIAKITHPNFSATQSQLQWNLNQLQDVSRLTGTAQFKIGAGSLDNLTGLASNPLVKVALLPIIILQKVASLIPHFPSLDHVDFSEITGQYAFDNGMMTVKESHLNSSIINAQMTGTADLKQEQVNFRVSNKIAGITVDFTVKGPMENPSVKLDASSLLKQPAVNQAIQQGKKLLQGLFK